MATAIIAAPEDGPESFDWILNLARSRASATLKACEADYKKGKLKPQTFERNREKWNATIAQIDTFRTLARI